MWALIAFIILSCVVTALIEINERIKAKKAKEEGPAKEDCAKKDAKSEDCSACELISVCEKEKPTSGQ